MSRTLYAAVVAMRDAEWGLTPLGDTEGDPATDTERRAAVHAVAGES